MCLSTVNIKSLTNYQVCSESNFPIEKYFNSYCNLHATFSEIFDWIKRTWTVYIMCGQMEYIVTKQQQQQL